MINTPRLENIPPLENSRLIVNRLCDQGRLDTAMEITQAGVEALREETPDDKDRLYKLVSMLELLGDVQRLSEDLDRARISYQEALDISKGLEGNAEQVARIYTYIAIIYDSAGLPDEAIPFYHYSIKVSEELSPPPLVSIADVSNNLASLAKRIGEYSFAEEHYLKALNIYNDVLGDRDLKGADVINNLGSLYLEIGQIQLAEEMYKQSLDIRVASLPDGHRDIGQVSSNLGLALYQLGDKGEALKMFDKAWSIYSQNVSETPESYAFVAENFIMTLKESGDYEKAQIVEAHRLEFLQRDKK